MRDIDVRNMEKYRQRHENAVLFALKVELAFALIQQLIEGKLLFITDMLTCLSSSYGEMTVKKSPLQIWQPTPVSYGHLSWSRSPGMIQIRTEACSSCPISQSKGCPSHHGSDHGTLHLGKSASQCGQGGMKWSVPSQSPPPASDGEG